MPLNICCQPGVFADWGCSLCASPSPNVKCSAELNKYIQHTVGPTIEIGVYGGYTDIRGDAAKNSLSLLKSLYSHWVRNT